MKRQLYIVSQTLILFQKRLSVIGEPEGLRKYYSWKFESSMKRQLHIMQYDTYPNTYKRVREGGRRNLELLRWFITDVNWRFLNASGLSPKELVNRIVTNARRREPQLKVTYTSLMTAWHSIIDIENQKMEGGLIVVSMECKKNVVKELVELTGS